MCTPRDGARPCRAADRSGFTLLEVLVALTIMAAIMAVMYRSVVITRAGALAFDGRTRADLVARSLFADFLARRDLHDGFYHGDRGGLSWTLSAHRLDLTPQLPPPPPPSEAEGVDAAVAAGSMKAAAEGGGMRWQPQRLVLDVGDGGRPIEMEAVRLVRAAADSTGAQAR